MTTATKQDSDAKAVFRRFTEAAAELIDCLEVQAGENEAAERPPAARPAPNGRRPSEEDRENFRRLAEAFATLFELDDYLPDLLRRDLHDHYTDIVHEVNLDNPHVIRATFPLLAEMGCLQFTDEEGGEQDGEE